MGDPPQRLAAALSDRYRIERELGAGGMATVYLADDLKHDRKVAIKVLKPELAAVVGAERFLAEIRTTANLQHPHILPLFDSGEAEGFLYYVMPYVEGESLRERLDREKQLPVEEAVTIARDVAEALQHAHAMGVVHRDIKPANILLRDARPQVADFGISLALTAAGEGRLTETGLSVGTPHYMSPEQAAADRDVDPRSDIYALGCVLYEMLAGEPPFAGPTAQAVLARLLTEEPRDLTTVRRTVPGNVAAAVARALEKLPADRFPDAGGFAAALGDPTFSHSTSASAPGSGGRGKAGRSLAGSAGVRRAHAALTAVLALVTAVLVLTRGGGGPGTVPAPPLAFVASDTGRILAVEVADDGTVAWGQDGLFLRSADGIEPRPVTREELSPDGENPLVQAFSISPDGRRLAIMAGEEIYTFSLATGARNRVLHLDALGASLLQGVHWALDGWIYTVANFQEGEQAVVRVPDVGGEAEELFRTTPDHPDWLNVTDVIPGDGGLLLGLFPRDGFHPRVGHLEPRRGEITVVAADSVMDGAWSPTGHVVYGRIDGSLVALPWSPERRAPEGPALLLRDDVGTQGGPPRLSLGSTGTLAYVAGPPASVDDVSPPEADDGAYHLEWMHPDGRFSALELEPTDHGDASVSRDGRRVAYTRGGAIRVFDVELGTDRVVVPPDSVDLHDPVWSPDGRFLAYGTREGRIAVIATDGSGSPRFLPGGADSTLAFPTQWLEDGTILLAPQVVGDALAIPSDGSSPPRPLLEGGRPEYAARVSPDGRWIAFFTERGDERQMVVRRWPELDREMTVSAEGDRLDTGLRLVWKSDSAGIVYGALSAGATVSQFFEARLDPEMEGGVVQRRSIQLAPPQTGQIRGATPDGRVLVVSQGVRLSGLGVLNSSLAERVVVISDLFALIRERAVASGR